MKYKIEINGKSHEVEVEEKGTLYVVTVDGISYEARIAEEKRKKLSEPQVPKTVSVSSSAPLSKAETIPGSVTTPMPGTILSVHVETGDRVEVGDVLFTLEAMKMENEISSPASGTVKKLHVKEGQTVNTGDLLAVIS